jgi:hypothetical protein
MIEENNNYFSDGENSDLFETSTMQKESSYKRDIFD